MNTASVRILSFMVENFGSSRTLGANCWCVSLAMTTTQLQLLKHLRAKLERHRLDIGQVGMPLEELEHTFHEPIVLDACCDAAVSTCGPLWSGARCTPAGIRHLEEYRPLVLSCLEPILSREVPETPICPAGNQIPNNILCCASRSPSANMLRWPALEGRACAKMMENPHYQGQFYTKQLRTTTQSFSFS